MTPIPVKVRRKLALDPWMKKCCYCGAQTVEWDHALKYSSRQIQEWYAIVPLCKECHRGENGTISREVRDFTKLLAITRGIRELQKNYPKYDWLQEKRYLENKLKTKIFN